MANHVIKIFNNDEEKRIQAEVAEYQKKAREAEIQTEIRNRILDAEKKLPGKKYH